MSMTSPSPAALLHQRPPLPLSRAGLPLCQPRGLRFLLHHQKTPLLLPSRVGLAVRGAATSGGENWQEGRIEKEEEEEVSPDQRTQYELAKMVEAFKERKELPPAEAWAACVTLENLLELKSLTDVLPQVAKELAEQLIRLRQLPRALSSSLIILLGKLKLADLCIEVEKESRKVNGGADLNVINALLNTLAHLGHYKEAEELIKEMPELGLIPDSTSLTALVGSYARCGRSEDVLYTISQMQNAGMQLESTLRNFAILWLSEHKDLATAEQILNASIAGKKQLTHADLRTFNQMLSSCLRLGDLERGHAVFERMIKTGLRPDRFARNCLDRMAVIKLIREGPAFSW